MTSGLPLKSPKNISGSFSKCFNHKNNTIIRPVSCEHFCMNGKLECFELLDAIANIMKIFSWVFVLAVTVRVCYSKGISSRVGASCLYIANNFTEYRFDCAPPDLSYKCRCNDPSFLGTILICVDDNAESVEITTGAYQYLSDMCYAQAKIALSFKDLASAFENSTNYYIPESKVRTNVTLRYPVRITSEKYEESLKAIDSLLDHRSFSTFVGLLLLGYWGIVIFCATVYNIFVWCTPSILIKFNPTLIRWTRRHIILPQIFARNIGKKRSSTFSNYISKILSIAPTRFQAIIILLYLVLVIILSLVKYEFVMPNTVMGALCVEHRIYIADRAGIIAITQLPLLLIFSSRNNIFQSFTGWSYRNFNIFHRWISRIVLVLIIIHASLYVDFTRRNGDYYDRWSLAKWRFANAALTSICIICGLSYYKIREMFYEFFKLSHKLLAVVFIVGTWHHCFTLGWMEYVYVTVGIWSYDYFIRICKIFISGGVVYAKCQAVTENISGKTKDGTVIPFKKVVHSIRITVDHSGWWRVFPGSYVYIYFMKHNMFWQSHPFTTFESSDDEHFNQLVMIMRVKNGLTKRLGNWLLTQPNYEARVPVLIEGPYGSIIGFYRYDNAVFVAGGIGFTVLYSLSMDLARTYKSKESKDRNSDKHSIQFLWITPGISNVVANIQELLAISKIGRIRLSIYITREDKPPKFNENRATGVITMNTQENVQIVDDRPLTAIVEDVCTATTNSPGRADAACQSSSKECQRDHGSLDSDEQTMDSLKHYEELELTRVSRSSDASTVESDPQHRSFENKRVRDTWRLFQEGFPNIFLFLGVKPELKEETIHLVNALDGSTAIVSCGPDKMNCDIRDGAAKCLRDKGPRVDYFEEKLLW